MRSIHSPTGHHSHRFNSNGWLKSCERNKSGCPIRAVAGTDDYVGSAPGVAPGGCYSCTNAASETGPMPPAARFVDFHYPPEEPAERREMLAAMPFVVSAAGVSANGTGTAVLGLGNLTATVAVNDTAFGMWAVVSFMILDTDFERPVMVVLERAFDRWSALVFLSAEPKNAAPPPVVIRSGVGVLEQIVQPNYTFADPCYFKRVTETPVDYLGSFLLRNASVPGEPTYAEAAAVLAPPHDYKLLGVPSSYHKWSCTQDGYIKRATKGIYGMLA